MATLHSALRAGVIEEYRLPQHDLRTPRRSLYLAEVLFNWIDQTDEIYEIGWSASSGRRSRFEHLEQTFGDFRCDERPLVGELNRVMPTGKGVWKIHSPGMRIFGWVPAPHSFVGVSAAFTAAVHGPNSAVKTHIDGVLNFVTKHGLENTIHYGDRSALFPTPA